jgi:hypothetical protein
MIAFDEETHTYHVDGVRYPSVTEVLAPQTDWSHVPAWQLEAARCLGRDVHAAVNLLARGLLNEELLDPAIAPYVNGAVMFLNHTGATVLAAEQRVACKAMRVAGTLDLLLYWQDCYYFVDWKVSDAVPKTVGAQLAAYEYLYSQTFPGAIKHSRTRRLCVRLKHNDYRTHRCAMYSTDLNLFRACAVTWWNRQERKYG